MLRLQQLQRTRLWLLRQLLTEQRDRGRSGRFAPVGTPTNPPVDAEYVEGVRAAVRELVALDGRRGGVGTSRQAVRWFRSVRRMVPGSAGDRDFAAAAAELGEVTGWLLYDADRQVSARRVNREALELSRLAGDRSMELFVLTNMSMQSLYVHRPREALGIADTALACYRLPPRVASLFRLRRARALAVLGDRDGALATMARVRADFTDGVSTRDPFWTWWVDDCELVWHKGMVHANLGDWAPAIDEFSRSLELGEHTDTRRGRYARLACLLAALVHVRDWSRAEPVALELLPMAREVGSGRATRLLRRTSARATSAPATVHDIFAELERGAGEPRRAP